MTTPPLPANDLLYSQLHLAFQPQAETLGGRMVGLEALACRLGPAGLVPLQAPEASDTSAASIGAITAWLLRTACMQVHDWQLIGVEVPRLTVTVSVRDVELFRLAQWIQDALQQAHLDPHRLFVQLRDCARLGKDPATLYQLDTLKSMGLQIGVDEFIASPDRLIQLKHMHIAAGRIQGDAIHHVNSDPDAANTVKSLIGLLHGLQMHALATDVANEGQLRFLCEEGCDEVQGPIYSPPLDASACLAFMTSGPLLPHTRQKIQAGDRTLLLVDDEHNITSALRRLLRTEGYRILVAESGRQGLELLAGHEVGVIISDQRMPEMTGVEFLRQVKRLYPDTIRMVLSGYTELKSVTDAINEGAIYKFITKPWDDDLLRENVREAFQRFDMQQENHRLSQELLRVNKALSQLNQDLERRVEEKTREIQHGIRVLEVAQEVLQRLPIATIAIDQDDQIVMANQRADALFPDGGPLFGCDARDRLPAAFLDQAMAAQEGARVNGGNGLTWQIHWFEFAANGMPGKVLVITHTEQEALSTEVSV